MYCRVAGGWIEDCSKELGKKAAECCIREKSMRLLRDHNSIESSSLRTANPVLLQEKGGGV